MVLVDILVYWLSLARIHVFVLNIFRKKMFNLLWGGEAIGKKIHLMKWETVVKSKEFGGWDIKNLCWYSMALHMKSMWIYLIGKGLWNMVIMDKYLHNRSLTC